jgi:hypothetical protein
MGLFKDLVDYKGYISRFYFKTFEKVETSLSLSLLFFVPLSSSSSLKKHTR